MKSRVTFHSPIHVDVKSFSTTDIYHINLEEGTCTCIDFVMNNINRKIVGYVCKHIVEAERTLYGSPEI